MNKNEFRQRLEDITPPVPDVVHSAMVNTLNDICAKEHNQALENPPRRQGLKRGTLLVLIAALLLVATVAAAALLKLDLFEMIMGATPPNSEELVQNDLFSQQVDNCLITVKSAAYDGMSLYLVYSIRDLLATEPLGELDEYGMRYVNDDYSPGMRRDKVGWWTDTLWIDGKDIDIPGGTSWTTVGSETPGELLFYQWYRLDNAGIYLDADTVISLPIGKDQDTALLISGKGTENVSIRLPEDGVASFKVDCSARDRVVITHPNEPASWQNVNACVTDVVYSPLQMYLTLNIEATPEALAAYKAEHGEGYYDENGNLMWPYSSMDVTDEWVFSAALVKKDGSPVFEDMSAYGFTFGCDGHGDTQAWFLFPWLEQYPDEMFLAPVVDGQADMTQAVRVK